MDVLYRYAFVLDEVSSRLVIASVDQRIREQLDVAGITVAIGAASVYLGDERVGATLARAEDDAARWVAARAGGGGESVG